MKRKRHTPEEIIKKLREAATQDAPLGGQNAHPTRDDAHLNEKELIPFRPHLTH
jgi:hypothetical protein